MQLSRKSSLSLLAILLGLGGSLVSCSTSTPTSFEGSEPLSTGVSASLEASSISPDGFSAVGPSFDVGSPLRRVFRFPIPGGGDVTIGNPEPFISVAGSDPEKYVVDPGKGFDGVVRLSLPVPGQGTFTCTGSLLSTGEHILTAAHCVTIGVGSSITVQNPTVIFDLPSGSVGIQVPTANIAIHPTWTNENPLVKGDVAILKLPQAAPAAAERYEIYRNSDEIGQVFRKIGYGLIGTGNSGTTGFDPQSRKFGGWNRFDTLNDTYTNPLWSAIGETVADPGQQLNYDFDNGTFKNDGFGYDVGVECINPPQPGLVTTVRDRGLRPFEVGTAGGDSGGPAFLNGQIAGVTSYGYTLAGCPNAPDIDGSLNSSFGEYAGDTRVSAYQGWIDFITSR